MASLLLRFAFHRARCRSHVQFVFSSSLFGDFAQGRPNSAGSSPQWQGALPLRIIAESRSAKIDIGHRDIARLSQRQACSVREAALKVSARAAIPFETARRCVGLRALRTSACALMSIRPEYAPLRRARYRIRAVRRPRVTPRRAEACPFARCRLPVVSERSRVGGSLWANDLD